MAKVVSSATSACRLLIQHRPRSGLTDKVSGVMFVPRRFNGLLTPLEVSEILRANEVESDSEQVVGAVKSFDRNVLASNDPIEDSHAEGLFNPRFSNGAAIFGVFDGHAGGACAQVVSKRLFPYIAASLLDEQELQRYCQVLEQEGDNSRTQLVTTTDDDYKFMPELETIYDQSFREYLNDLSNSAKERKDYSVGDRLQHAFVTLDRDIAHEVRESFVSSPQLTGMMETVASSGCVAAVSMVQNNDLWVANCGDCKAVLGTLSENNTWVAKSLTKDHNTDNFDEIKRIMEEHPGEKEDNIIRGDRLLGMLAPLRAFGDFRFKWPAKDIVKYLGNKLGPTAVADKYLTPPYLTALPEITHHKLSPRDKFLVIASDGLWDMMTPMQVIRLVGEHLSGKITLKPFQLSGHQVTLKEILTTLRQRQKAMKLKPTDINAATHLIRNALGGSVYGVDHAKLAHALDLPQDMKRMFRDDITVIVVYFDQDYLREC